jgi:flagellar biosynthesis protein
MKKSKKAVALRYQAEKDHAPRLTAKGGGLIAKKIIQLARAHGIPITEDPDLVEVLVQLDWQEHIPPQLYQAVAEVLAFVYRLNRKSPTASHFPSENP